MTQTTQENPLSDEEIKQIQARAMAVKEQEGLSWSDVATASGIPAGTVSNFITGKYAGDNDKVGRKVKTWLDDRDEKRQALSIVPIEPGFQVTPSSSRFIDTIRYAQAMPEIVVIATPPGFGKTTSIRKYAASSPNVWVVTACPELAGHFALLCELCDTINVIERSAARMAAAIRKKIANTNGLIIIDDAQHLSTKALDQLRYFYDVCNIGIALVGNEEVYSQLGDGKTAKFAQLFSRVGHRITQTRIRSKDIEAILNAWNVTDAKEVKFLKTIASRPGALREVTKIIKLASLIAAGAAVPRSIEHFEAAVRRRHEADQVTEAG